MGVFTSTGSKRQREIISVSSALAVIARQKEPISRAVKTQFERLIETDAAVIVHDITVQDCRAYEEAVVREKHVTQHLKETDVLCTTAQAELEAARTSLWSRFGALLFGGATIAVLLCENSITNVTLPSALDVARTSLLGVALSLGPTTAFLFVEKPLEYLQQSAWRKTYLAFLWLVFAALLVTVFYLAEARHEIVRVGQEILQGKQHIVFNDEIVSRAILALSLLLVVVGGCFLMWARQCGRPWLHYRKARARVRRLHRRREALRKR